MKKEDIKKGARVRCVYNRITHRFSNKIGTINNVRLYEDYISYTVLFDDGFEPHWENPDSFELVSKLDLNIICKKLK